MEKRLRRATNVKEIKLLASECSHDASMFNSLIQSISHPDNKIANMAAWTASHTVEINSNIIKLVHHKFLISLMKKTKIGGIKRNIVRIWQFSKLQESILAEVVTIALNYFSNPKEDIAVRAFSITILQNSLMYIPELESEITFLIEKELPNAGPAIASRSRKCLKFIDNNKRIKRI
jgi:hypothetical protein